VAGYEWQRSKKDHGGGYEKSLTRPHLAGMVPWVKIRVGVGRLVAGEGLRGLVMDERGDGSSRSGTEVELNGGGIVPEAERALGVAKQVVWAAGGMG
jgi:hypothetical protein